MVWNGCNCTIQSPSDLFGFVSPPLQRDGTGQDLPATLTVTEGCGTGGSAAEQGLELELGRGQGRGRVPAQALHHNRLVK